MEDSIGVMQSLFAPFPETMFPRTLDTISVAGLLKAPLACKVPLTQSHYQHAYRLFPDLFCPETTTSAHDLHPHLITALQASWPTGTPTELLLTPFWDTVGYRLPEFAAGHLGIAASENRSVLSGCDVHVATESLTMCGLPHISLGCLKPGSVQELSG